MKNIAYIGSWKHFVFVFVYVWVSLSLYLFFVSLCLGQCHHQMISFHKIIFKKKHFQEVSEQTSMNYVFLLRPESISSQHTPLATKTPAWNPSLDQVPRCSTCRCWTVRSCAPWPRWQQIILWCIWASCYWIGVWFTDCFTIQCLLTEVQIVKTFYHFNLRHWQIMAAFHNTVYWVSTIS